MPDSTRSNTVEDLEADKLRMELRKLTAEAEQAEYEARLKSIELEDNTRQLNAFRRSERRRSYELTGTISPHSVEAARLTLWRWVDWDSENGNHDTPYEINITSSGGSVLDGYSLFDDIRAISQKGHPVTTRVRGFSASMAGVILQAGDTRLIGPESRLHIHEPSSGSMGKASDIGDTANLLNSMLDQICEIYSRRSRMTADEIRDKVRRQEWWLSAKDAIDLGFADAIGL